MVLRTFSELIYCFYFSLSTFGDARDSNKCAFLERLYRMYGNFCIFFFLFSGSKWNAFIQFAFGHHCLGEQRGTCWCIGKQKSPNAMELILPLCIYKYIVHVAFCDRQHSDGNQNKWFLYPFVQPHSACLCTFPSFVAQKPHSKLNKHLIESVKKMSNFITLIFQCVFSSWYCMISTKIHPLAYFNRKD